MFYISQGLFLDLVGIKSKIYLELNIPQELKYTYKALDTLKDKKRDP
jgi:hypothetical protein